MPELDDEFAQDLGEFETLEALRARVLQDLAHEAEQKAERDVRNELLKQLATRVTFDGAGVARRARARPPDRGLRPAADGAGGRPAAGRDRLERVPAEPAGRRARDSVASALVLDEVARREGLSVSEAEIEAELSRFGERTGRTTAAVRAQLEKEGGISRLATGLRREKSIDFLMSRATIVSD